MTRGKNMWPILITALFFVLSNANLYSQAGEGYSFPQQTQELMAALDEAYDDNQDLFFNTQIRAENMDNFLSYVVRTSMTEFEGRWLVGDDASGNGFLYISGESVQKLYGHYREAKQRLDEVYAGFGFTDESPAEKAEIMKRWLQTNVRQDENCSNNSLYGALVMGSSKCRGYAIAFKQMCDLAGIPCQTVSGQAEDGDKLETHLWNRIQLDGEWINVDVMWGMEGVEPLQNHYEEEYYQ